MKQISILIATLALMAATVSGQTRWQLDRAHSNVGFTVTHMVIAEVDGRFTDFDVTFESDGDDFTGASVEAVIKMASINTDNQRRDDHLRSADFFDAEKFPEMTFRSTKFEKAGDNKYTVTGELTMRGNTKPVVLDVTYRGSITDPRGNTKIALKGTTTIDRFEFGTVWNKTLETGGLIVGKDVDVTLNIELNEVKPEPKG